MPASATYMSDVGEALSVKHNNHVYELQDAGHDITVLSLGEAFFDVPLFSFDSLPHPALYHYSHSRGLPEFRNKLAGYYQSQYGVSVDPTIEMMVTAGSKIVIYMALMAILDPGDEVVIHEPAWVSYVDQVKLCRGIPVTVPYHVDVLELDQYITPRTKAIILNYPNNPCGRTLSKDEWDQLHQIAERNNLYLISDEAYSDFVPADETFVSCGVGDPTKQHSIICNSMSKNYGISGWRIGYVITNSSLIQEMLKINQHLITCPPTILCHYVSEHFDELGRVTKPQIQELLQGRMGIMTYLDSLGMSYLPGTATFYFFISINGSSLGSMDFCERLLSEYRISAVPGIGYGDSCDGFVRVSIGTESMERTRRGIDAINELVRQTLKI